MPRTPAQRKWQLAYGRRRRRAFVAAGLRSDGKPREHARPCGCKNHQCLKCAKADNKRILRPELVAAMYADYQSGMSTSAVGKKYNRARKNVTGIFNTRGLKLREVVSKPRMGWGVLIPEPTLAGLESLAAAAPRLAVPPEIKVHWRKWSFAKRRQFIAMLRKKFPSTRPRTPFSKNVSPFEYGTPAAHAIADKLNAGRNSQTKAIAMKPGSEGVIYRGTLYFWASGDTYVRGCGWNSETGRPILKRVIWEEVYGPVPYGMLVTQKDGNPNNFDPSNLELLSMAENARRNRSQGKMRKGTVAAAALLNRFNSLDQTERRASLGMVMPTRGVMLRAPGKKP